MILMNKKNARSISQKEIHDVLPNWWIESFNNVLSMMKHSKFVNFKKAELFFDAALSHILVEKEDSEIKHIKVKCFDKGTKDGFLYITIEIYFKMKDESLWKLSKSLHVKERKKLTCD